MPRRPRTAARKHPKQDRSRATVAALLDGTARVLARHGYAAASTNRIAEAAGVNVGSLYQYFPNKDALVAALIDRQLEDIVQTVATTLEAERRSPLPVVVRALVKAYASLYARNPELYRTLIREVPRVERLNPILDLSRRMTDVIAAWLVDRRDIAVGDASLAAFVAVTAVDALVQAAVVARPAYLDGDAFVDEVTRLITRYLAVAPGERAPVAFPGRPRSSSL